jgi:hypothetical protein
VETAVERAIFEGNELARRHFLQLIGASHHPLGIST